MSQQQQRQPNFDNIMPPSKPIAGKGTLTPWTVARAIPGSIGSVDKIANQLGVPRPELRKFINDNPELREALDDELLAAKERVIEKTYDDCMNGSAVARQDFFKMVNGYFEKRETNKTGDAQPQIIIHLDAPKEKYKMLGNDGEIIEVDRKTYAGQPPADNGVLAGDNGDEEDGDDLNENDSLVDNDDETEEGEEGEEGEEDSKQDNDSF